jgi:class 3 adenylate cyclase
VAAVPPELTGVVAALDGTGWSCELTDAGWRSVWASNEMRLVLKVSDDEEDLGVGHHLLEARRGGRLQGITRESGEAWLRLHAPFVMHDTGLTIEELAKLTSRRYHDVLPHLRPAEPPPIWSFALQSHTIGGVRGMGFRLVRPDGTLLGNVFVYGSTMPASLLAFVARGDQRHFERMTALVEPGRREAAILFADVEGSTDRSRRLPSERYFEAIKRLTADIDDAILEQGGIVGKHAGDGVSAFFLADQCGSPAEAARSAVVAAGAIRHAAEALDGGWRVNVGVHWGATVYMGQFSTSGRLEVTALGDEVNECARIQEAARGGEVLASKPLLERLAPGDAAALGIDLSEIHYRLVAELPGATEKARRDAGSLPVAALGDDRLVV